MLSFYVLTGVCAPNGVRSSRRVPPPRCPSTALRGLCTRQSERETSTPHQARSPPPLVHSSERDCLVTGPRHTSGTRPEANAAPASAVRFAPPPPPGKAAPTPTTLSEGRGMRRTDLRFGSTAPPPAKLWRPGNAPPVPFAPTQLRPSPSGRGEAQVASGVVLVMCPGAKGGAACRSGRRRQGTRPGTPGQGRTGKGR